MWHGVDQSPAQDSNTDVNISTQSSPTQHTYQNTSPTPDPQIFDWGWCGQTTYLQGQGLTANGTHSCSTV